MDRERKGRSNQGWFGSEMSEMEMEELAKEKRMADPDERAACVEFLASDNSSFVTGTTLIADGGGAIVDVGMLGFL